jgi:hypothetical protein
MIVRAKDLKSGALAADLAALLSERDLLGRDAGADIGERLNALRRGSVNKALRERIKAAARQIRGIAGIAEGGEQKLRPARSWRSPGPIASRRRAVGAAASVSRAAVVRSCPNMIPWRGKISLPSRRPTEHQATRRSFSPRH